MADVVGLVASIIAVVELAGKAAAASYGYIGGVKRAPEEIKKFYDELNSLANVLATLKDCVTANPRSIPLQALGASLQECISEMQVLEAKLKPKIGWRRKLARYKWPLKVKETGEYTARIERHKTLFTLVLNTDQLSRTKIIETRTRNIETDMQELKARHKDEKRKKVLHWLSPQAFDTKHIEISGRRQESTGEWLLNRLEVRDWVKKNPNSPLLWGYGIPGSGKTFLSSRVIDHLLEQAPRSHYGVAYVYFDYKERDQQKPVDVLASMVKQLLCQLRVIPKEIEESYDIMDREHKRPRLNDLYTMLLVVIKSFDQTFIVCDALDECDQDDQRRELLPLFHRMGRDGMNVFLTSREHPEDIQDSLQGSARVELSAQAEDITSYVNQKIYDNPRARRLFAQGDLKARVISELTGHTKGMFLLVRFHMEYLCQQTTVREILKEIEKLSSSLSEDSPLDPIYNRAMGILRDQHKNLVARALKILSWLVKGRRTLTVRELQQAVSVEQGQTELDNLDLLDRKTILDICASLVTIDEKSDTVRLAHYTVQEYILKHSIIPADAEFKIAMACTTFLAFGVFSQGACTSKSSLEVRFDQYPLLDYAAQKLSFHLKHCSEVLTTDLVLRFLRSPGCISSFTQAFYIPKGTSDRWDEFPRNHLALHIAASLGHCSVVRLLLEEKVDIMAQNGNGHTALHCAADGGHDEVIRLLLEKGADILATDAWGWSALHGATTSGHESVVRLLLEKGADISAKDLRGRTALHGAITYAYEPVVRLLLEKGADTSAADNQKRTALHCASQDGDETLVQLLLGKGADVTVVDYQGATPLHRASTSGNESVVRLLLEKGADIEAADDLGATALSQAAGWGNKLVTLLLLEKGADISTREGYGLMPLHGAATNGHESVVQLLLERGADISATYLGGVNALHKAAENGHESVAELLFQKGADISVADDHGETALYKAANNGHESVVRFLLAKDADISAANEFGMTALFRAAARGNESMVRLLIEKGANISTTDKRKRTVLHWAAQEGNVTIVQLLIDKGANISAQAEGAGTPLHWAADQGHEPVVRLLVEKGADVSARDGNGGSTVLHTAATSGHTSVVRLLIEKGAEISAVDDLGWTALSKAAVGGHKSVVSVLLEKGANPSDINKLGQNALHAAAYYGHEPVARLLLEKDADISATDGQRQTALHWAVRGGHELVVKLLLDKGADPSAKDENGKAAMSTWNPEVIH